VQVFSRMSRSESSPILDTRLARAAPKMTVEHDGLAGDVDQGPYQLGGTSSTGSLASSHAVMPPSTHTARGHASAR
jgi:hypothetical protein